MNPERWKRLKALFTHASELPPEDRLSYLERECAGDVELLQEILEMLASAAGPGPALKSFSPLASRAAAVPSLAGSKFADFEVERELGRGGMGVVYLARQISLDRRVALKVLLPHLAKSSDQVARFVHEAQKVAKLDHPGIVAVYSVGSEEDRHYFAMEFVPGHDLASELEALRPLAITDHVPRHLPAFDSREYLPAVVELAIQAGEALAHAHDRGVIHRDVKPRNLLLADDGRLVLVDFGLARDARFGEITNTGDVAGTPHYMSPEQAETRSRRRIDHRTDVYSLGVVLYEMLTLRRPFDGQTSIDILRQIANREPNAIERSNPRVPRDLRTICFKAMEKRPEDRYPTARELALDLQRFQRHESIHARPPSLVRRARSFVRRRRWILAASAVAALGLGVGALVASSSVRAKDDSELCSLLESRLEIDEVSNADAQALMSTERFEAVNEGGSAKLRELHARMKERFGERRERLLHDIQALLARAEHKPRTSLDVPAEEVAPSAAEIARAVAAFTAYTGSALDPTLLPKALCRVALEVKTGTATPAFTLIVQRLDPITGKRGRAERVVAARDAQGRFELNLAPGPYRITAVEPGVGFAEFTRVFSSADVEYAIAAWIRGDDEVRRTAKRITGAKYNVQTYAARRDGESGNELVSVEYELDDYDLDRTPVTCAEFARFLAETKAPRPAFWSDTSAQDWPTRPVTMIPADEAQLFAEWRGMRLPSLAEWEFAVRGVGRAKFPPAISDADPTLGGLRAGVEGPKRYLPRDEGFAELRRWYAINVLPVGSSPAFVGDIKDVLGNVQEWCDSWDFDFVEGEYRGSPGLRIRYGSSCHDPLSALKSKGLEIQTQAPISTAEVYCGFRCAKSARPPSVD